MFITQSFYCFSCIKWCISMYQIYVLLHKLCINISWNQLDYMNQCIRFYVLMYEVICIVNTIFPLINIDSTFFGLCKLPNLMNILMFQLKNPRVWNTLLWCPLLHMSQGKSYLDYPNIFNSYSTSSSIFSWSYSTSSFILNPYSTSIYGSSAKKSITFVKDVAPLPLLLTPTPFMALL
jgi:hypothetical protein